jgi:hypothetical protein
MEFPVRFKIETAGEGDADFLKPELYLDHTDRDCDGTFAHKVETFTPVGAAPVARYVRLTVTRMPEAGNGKQAFRLWRFEAVSGGKDVAEGCDLSDSFNGRLGKHELLRPRRPDGELAHFDHPENVSTPENWNPPVPQLRTPRSGITIGGFFGMLLERNEQYLLNGFTVSDMDLRAVTGGWDIYHNDFEHTGGSIAICEGDWFPSKSYRLRQHTGELCGSAFWTYLNQQFRLLNPYDEKYAAEIEKSIYNAAAANQCENGDILYHAHLLAPKHSHEENDRNSCCEGQGTRMLGSLPEFIYKIADDGIFVDLFNESAITWEQSGEKWTLSQHTDFPYQPDVKLKVTPGKPSRAMIRIRVPSWATKPVTFFVNGKREATAAPGTYVILDRQWKNKDEINFTLPMGFRLTKYAGIENGFRGKEAYALEYGPVLMAVVGESILKGEVNIPYTESELTGKLKPIAGKPLHFTIDGTAGKLEYIPYFDVKGTLLDTFTCYPFLKLNF